MVVEDVEVDVLDVVEVEVEVVVEVELDVDVVDVVDVVVLVELEVEVVEVVEVDVEEEVEVNVNGSPAAPEVLKLALCSNSAMLVSVLDDHHLQIIYTRCEFCPSVERKPRRGGLYSELTRAEPMGCKLDAHRVVITQCHAVCPSLCDDVHLHRKTIRERTRGTSRGIPRCRCLKCRPSVGQSYERSLRPIRRLLSISHINRRLPTFTFLFLSFLPWEELP